VSPFFNAEVKFQLQRILIFPLLFLRKIFSLGPSAADEDPPDLGTSSIMQELLFAGKLPLSRYEFLLNFIVVPSLDPSNALEPLPLLLPVRKEFPPPFASRVFPPLCREIQIYDLLLVAL